MTRPWLGGMLLAAIWACPGRVAIGGDPEIDAVGRLDEAFAASVAGLAARAEALGDRPLADSIRAWEAVGTAAYEAAAEGRQIAYAIPPRLERPDSLTPAGRGLWEEFLQARRRRAEGLFVEAAALAGGDGTSPADAGGIAGRNGRHRPQAALALVYRALRDDPDHAAARRAAGFEPRAGGWAWPQAARHLDRGEEFDPAFGWLPRGRLARYRAGERHEGGRWITAAEDELRTLPVDRGRRFDSDHWQILSSAPRAAAAALAGRLEETLLIWRQVFGSLGTDPQAGLAARPAPAQDEPFAAVLCADRRQFVAELIPLEPAIERAAGIYWTPTRTAWFFHGPAEGGAAALPRADTVSHEATHQLWLETSRDPPASPRAGEHCGFWAIEALACQMESIRPAPGGWTVGGRDAGRRPRARELARVGALPATLAEIAALGRGEFQTHPRLEDLYAEVAALADFFLNESAGRYRDAFLDYCDRVYREAVDPDSLARLCGSTYPQLDREFRAALERE